MTIGYFQTLSLKSQKALATHKGVRLAEKHTKDYDAILYQLDGFYIELYYAPQTNIIVWINSFDDMDELDFYLEDINVNALSYL